MPSDRSKVLSPTQRQLMANAALDPLRRIVCPLDKPPASFGRTVQALASRSLICLTKPAKKVEAARQKTGQGEYVLSLLGVALIGSPPFCEPVSDAAVPDATASDAPPLIEVGAADTTTEAPRQSRHDQLVAMLSRPEGASVPALMAMTGWLPHTTRAALSGLRKKGYCLDRIEMEGEAAVYRIPAGQCAA